MPSSHSSADDLLAIAHITRAHGVRGEVSAVPLAPPVLPPADFILDRKLFLRDAKGKIRETEAEGVRLHQDRWLVKLAGIETMTDAETLRECDLCVPRAELPALPPGWFYETDLRGCRVIDERLGDIGEVIDLELGFVQPQLKVQLPNGKSVLLPWRDALFPDVDISGKKIESRLPAGIPGLEDLDNLPE